MAWPPSLSGGALGARSFQQGGVGSPGAHEQNKRVEGTQGSGGPEAGKPDGESTERPPPHSKKTAVLAQTGLFPLWAPRPQHQPRHPAPWRTPKQEPRAPTMPGPACAQSHLGPRRTRARGREKRPQKGGIRLRGERGLGAHSHAQLLPSLNAQHSIWKEKKVFGFVASQAGTGDMGVWRKRALSPACNIAGEPPINKRRLRACGEQGDSSPRREQALTSRTHAPQRPRPIAGWTRRPGHTRVPGSPNTVSRVFPS